MSQSQATLLDFQSKNWGSVEPLDPVLLGSVDSDDDVEHKPRTSTSGSGYGSLITVNQLQWLTLVVRHFE